MQYPKDTETNEDEDSPRSEAEPNVAVGGSGFAGPGPT